MDLERPQRAQAVAKLMEIEAVGAVVTVVAAVAAAAVAVVPAAAVAAAEVVAAVAESEQLPWMPAEASELLVDSPHNPAVASTGAAAAAAQTWTPEAWVFLEALNRDRQRWALSSWLHQLPLLPVVLACIQDGSHHPTMVQAGECPASGHKGPWTGVLGWWARAYVEACFGVGLLPGVVGAIVAAVAQPPSRAV